MKALSSRYAVVRLAAGIATAERLRKIGLIRAAALHLQGETRVAGTPLEISTSSQERILQHA